MTCKSSLILYFFLLVFTKKTNQPKNQQNNNKKKERAKEKEKELKLSWGFTVCFLLKITSMIVHVVSDFCMTTSAHTQGAWNEALAPGSCKGSNLGPHQVQSCDKRNCDDLLLTGVESSLQFSVTFQFNELICTCCFYISNCSWIFMYGKYVIQKKGSLFSKERLFYNFPKNG